jgi:hypothetical protein
VEGLPFAHPTGLIRIKHQTHGRQASPTHHKKSASQMRIGTPVWWRREKGFSLLHMPYPTHVKISDLLAPMIEGNGVPVACEIVQMQYVDLTLCQLVAMLRVVLHGQRTLFEGRPRQRLQEIRLDHHMRCGLKGQRPPDHVGIKGDLLGEQRS